MKTLSLIPLLLLAACDKAGGDAQASNAKAAPAGAAAVLQKWKDAGLTVTSFDPADGEKYGGGDCKSGQVNGVDVVLCTFASDEAATAAQPIGLETVGLTTGTALVTGPLMLVMADRRKADAEGRTINQATKIFRGR